MHVRIPLTLLGLCLALTPLSTTAQESVASPSYRLGSGDTVSITIGELPELGGERTIGDDGAIDLPVVGPFPSRGLTESQLAASLKARLEEKFVRRATVSVRVVAFRIQPVLILGAVGSPGNLALKGEARLLDVLLQAGGLSSNHGGIVRVRRQAENGLSDQVEIKTSDLIDQGDPMVNLPILAGDRITVPPATQHTIYFLGKGAQTNSVKFSSTERATLLAAIVRAGGLAETAARKVVIKRFDAGSELREIEADYKRILDGKDPDVELQDGDIIVVKESFF